MPEFDEEFKFPDEIDDDKDLSGGEELNEGGKVDKKDDFSLEIEDDTPPEDRNAVPLDKETVKELEEDDIEYTFCERVLSIIDNILAWCSI